MIFRREQVLREKEDCVICPLLAQTDPEGLCLYEKCAWWSVPHNGCAVSTVANICERMGIDGQCEKA